MNYSNPTDLASIAKQLVAPGKGILAADESNPTIEKRFKNVGVNFTEENRRDYREMLCSTPGLSEFISGGIWFDETLRQKARDGIPFPEFLKGGARHSVRAASQTLPGGAQGAGHAWNRTRPR